MQVGTKLLEQDGFFEDYFLSVLGSREGNFEVQETLVAIHHVRERLKNLRNLFIDLLVTCFNVACLKKYIVMYLKKSVKSFCRAFRC